MRSEIFSFQDSPRFNTKGAGAKGPCLAIPAGSPGQPPQTGKLALLQQTPTQDAKTLDVKHPNPEKFVAFGPQTTPRALVMCNRLAVASRGGRHQKIPLVPSGWIGAAVPRQQGARLPQQGGQDGQIDRPPELVRSALQRCALLRSDPLPQWTPNTSSSVRASKMASAQRSSSAALAWLTRWVMAAPSGPKRRLSWRSNRSARPSWRPSSRPS